MDLEYIRYTTEFQVFDRKSVKIDQKSLAVPMIAMANADGGVIALGVEDDGTLTGVDGNQKHLNELLRVPFDFCVPSVQVTPEYMDVEFVHRYHPNNQYQVTTLYEGKKEQHRCFLMNGQYHLTSNQLIAKEYIVSVEHIPCPKWEKWKQPGVDYDKNIMSTVPNARILRDDERL